MRNFDATATTGKSVLQSIAKPVLSQLSYVPNVLLYRMLVDSSLHPQDPTTHNVSPYLSDVLGVQSDNAGQWTGYHF